MKKLTLSLCILLATTDVSIIIGSDSESTSKKRTRSESDSYSGSESESSSSSTETNHQNSLVISSNSSCPPEIVKEISQKLKQEFNTENSAIVQISMTSYKNQDKFKVHTRTIVVSPEEISEHTTTYLCKIEETE